MNKKISIVIGYYNRKDLFYETLLSITRSKYKDFELIAVDDGSSPEQRLEDMVEEFPFIKIIRLENKDKWYLNSCIPLNIGIREAKGDIIVLQNPECLHVHDVLTYLSENIDDSNYISMSTYGIGRKITKLLSEYRNDHIVALLKSLPQQSYVGWESVGWYNHTIYRPVHYHFCSAISRNNMAKLNGFDERFGFGVAYDDDELILRIRRLGLALKIEDNLSVMHQYHESVWELPNISELHEKNRSLLVNTVMNETGYRANTTDLWNGN